MPPAEELDEPDGAVELTPPDVDGELTLPVAGELTVLPDGELVLTPVPLVAPLRGLPAAVLPLLIEPDVPLPDVPLLMEPEAPLPVLPLLIEPDAPLPVLGDADGLLETPAACIACWLHRSKSARVMLLWPMASAGSRSAPMAAAEPITLILIILKPP